MEIDNKKNKFRRTKWVEEGIEKNSNKPKLMTTSG